MRLLDLGSDVPISGREYNSKVRLWVTFNEPNVMAFCGWVWGTFPPARRFDHPGAGRHLGNQLKAHAAAYDAIKALPGQSIACTKNRLALE